MYTNNNSPSSPDQKPHAVTAELRLVWDVDGQPAKKPGEGGAQPHKAGGNGAWQDAPPPESEYAYGEGGGRKSKPEWPNADGCTHNIDAEMGVLGALIQVDGSKVMALADRLKPSDFFVLHHRTLFREVTDCAEAGRPFDAVSLKIWADTDTVFMVVGSDYLGLLLDSGNGMALSTFKVRVEMVAKLALQRQFVGLGNIDAPPKQREARRLLDEMDAIGADTVAVSPFDPEDAADMLMEPVEPRGWLLGNLMCKKYVTVVAGGGGMGKTAVGTVADLSQATGRPLLKMKVWRRSRVLVLTFEDGRDEYLRRLKAACLHHNIKPEDIKGWLYVKSLNSLGITLAKPDAAGAMIETGAAEKIVEVVRRMKIDSISLDPWVKVSGAPRKRQHGGGCRGADIGSHLRTRKHRHSRSSS